MARRQAQPTPTTRETPEQQAEMRSALAVLESAAQDAYGVANRTPAYHGYVDRLGQIIREIMEMGRMA